MRALWQAVDQFIKRHQLLHKSDAVIIGVSGGPDSMALLHYLHQVERKWNLILIAACADHGLRGEESEADVHYVATFCRENNIRFESTSLRVLEYQKKHGVSVQVAARACRYHFFAEQLEAYHANALALAHHGDDQIETMLMAQVRGTSKRGRNGMSVRRPFATGEIIRPLLAVDRDQIEAYCVRYGIHPRRDPSNEKDDYTRNRFRHHVLPFLKKENPNVHVHFQHESERQREDHLLLQQLAKKHLEQAVMMKSPEKVILSTALLTAAPIALQRRMIHLVLDYLYGAMPSSFSGLHIESLLDLLHSERTTGQLDFPLGCRAILSYDRLLFTYNKWEAEEIDKEHVLHVPGEVQLYAGTLTADIEKNENQSARGPRVFVCDADAIPFPLIVRTRRAGDRLLLRGMKGSKKVKTIFVDQKVPRHLRAIWPLVVSGAGEVLWLPLLKHSDAAPVSSKTKQWLVLHFLPSRHMEGDI